MTDAKLEYLRTNKISSESCTMVLCKNGCLSESENMLKTFKILIDQHLDIITASATYRCSATLAVDLDSRGRQCTTIKELVAGKASIVIPSIRKKKVAQLTICRRLRLVCCDFGCCSSS